MEKERERDRFVGKDKKSGKLIILPCVFIKKMDLFLHFQVGLRND